MRMTAFACLALLLLAACAKPLNESQLDFVGLWKNNETSLLITQDGRIDYETQKGAFSKSLSTPIKFLNANTLEAGVLFLNTTFTLDGKPKKEAGMTFIIVDGEKLFKADELGRIPNAIKVPKLAIIRELVSDELSLLAAGIQKQDFTDYINHSSLVFQSQFTNEQLLEIYGPYITQNININDWMVGDFTLVNEPSIDELGKLTVEGQYPTSPNSLKFNLSFVYSHPDWKGLGGKVIINDQ